MKKSADKVRTTSVTAYLSNRRKLALGILAGRIANGSIATIVTNLIEDTYGKELTEIEKTIVVPGSSEESKQGSNDEKEDALSVA